MQLLDLAGRGRGRGRRNRPRRRGRQDPRGASRDEVPRGPPPHTHGHFDTSALGRREARNRRSHRIHEADRPSTTRSRASVLLRPVGRDAAPARRRLHRRESIGACRFPPPGDPKPGHTPGSTASASMGRPGPSSGDTLFRRSIGRRTLGRRQPIRSSPRSARNSSCFPTTSRRMRKRPDTTIGEERRENPFVRVIARDEIDAPREIRDRLLLLEGRTGPPCPKHANPMGRSSSSGSDKPIVMVCPKGEMFRFDQKPKQIEFSGRTSSDGPRRQEREKPASPQDFTAARRLPDARGVLPKGWDYTFVCPSCLSYGDGSIRAGPMQRRRRGALKKADAPPFHDETIPLPKRMEMRRMATSRPSSTPPWRRRIAPGRLRLRGFAKAIADAARRTPTSAFPARRRRPRRKNS